MPSVEVVLALTGATSVLGVIALAGNYYLYLKVHAIEATKDKSVRELIEGEGLVRPEHVLAILQAVESGDRLDALKLLATLHKGQGASRVYEKIKGKIDVQEMRKQRFKHIRRVTMSVAPFLFLLAFSSLVYGAYSNPDVVAAISNFFKTTKGNGVPRTEPSSPSRPFGKVTVEPKIKVAETERTVHPTFRVGGRGKNSITAFALKVEPELARRGWKIDIEDLKAKGITWSQDVQDGTGSACVGLEKGSITEDGFAFQIRFGQKSSDPITRISSDAGINCSIGSVPLTRKLETYVAGKPIQSDLRKDADVRVSLPANTVSYVIKLAIDGQDERIITDDAPSPYDFLQIVRFGDSILFKVSS